MTRQDKINIQCAERIINDYNWGRELKTQEKRALMDAILDYSYFKSGYFLECLVDNFKGAGFNEQEALGATIVLGVNRGREGYKIYNFLVPLDSVERIKEKADTIEKNADESIILRAVSEYPTQEEQEYVIQQLMDIGVSSYFLEQRYFHNVYVAKAIVDGYAWKGTISDEEKRFLIEGILDSVVLDKKQNFRLINMISKFMKSGLALQEIYGILINYLINKRQILKDRSVPYAHLLKDTDNIIETIGECKSERNATVNMAGLMARVSENLTDEEKEKAKAYIESLGICINNKESSSVLYMTQRIVEAYDFERKLLKSEKSFVAKSILSIKPRPKNSLIVLVRRLVEAGLDEQQIYAIILNLAVNKGCLVGGKIYNYEDFMKEESCQSIVDGRAVIDDVTVELIDKQMSDPESILRKAVRGQVRSGRGLSETREELVLLTNMEVIKKQQTLGEDGMEQE